MTHKVFITDKAVVTGSLKMNGTKAYGIFQTNGKNFTFTIHDHDDAKSMSLIDAKWFLDHAFEEYNGALWLNMEQTLYFGDRVISVHVHPNYL
ncbi:hypothetical protein BGZ70_003404 [Mortierella alpina]|uniref:Uncharacterized protein n=1 Tax=Mortierella alpina TaxID=64518 RepID=A0A9P6LWE0_MORAP|nr:hypothetical protein BGZ70_003404 [Mortierella alpina]